MRQAEYPRHPDDIFATGIAEVPLPVDPDFQWIVVPEADFEAALEAVPPEQRNSQPEWLGHLEGASSISNDPWTAGVIANSTYPQDLAGRYWIVASDPGMAEPVEGGPPNGIIITKEYRLAIIDLNIPKSVWFGAGSRAVRRPNSNLGMGRCVGEEQVCVATGGGSPCGAPAYCGETRYLQPGQLQGWFESLTEARKKPPTLSVNAEGLLPQIACLPPRLRGCGNSTWGSTIEIDPNGRYDVSIPHSTCTGTNIDRQVSGTIPPAECTYAGFGGALISGGGRFNSGAIAFSNCEGRCFSCESSNGAIDSTGRPRFCNLMKPATSGGLCEADNAQRAADQLNAEAQWIANGATLVGSQRCDPPNSQGVRACLSCDNGVCKTTVSVDMIRPNQTVQTTCGTRPCAPGTIDSSGGPVMTGVSEASTTPAMPLRQGAQRPARPTSGVGRTIDTVDALPSMIPQINASQKKHPIADGQIRDDAPNNSNAEPATELTEDKPKTELDPVALMAGSLEISHTDLSFAGPVRPLEFSRQYSSQGFDRSELGSNWAHNWDVRVIPLRHENLPDGVDPFCAGTPEETTCVMLRDGNSAKLYMRDRRDGLFKPQAGSFSTLMKNPDGWYLRSPDFHVQRFDLDGYLVYDADRFGNAFKLEYELNAWGGLTRRSAQTPSFDSAHSRELGSMRWARSTQPAPCRAPCSPGSSAEPSPW